MIEAARVWWRTLRHLQHRGYIYVWGTLCWAGLSLPIVTAPAAWAGLVKMSHLAQTSPHADLNDFWEGFRENLKRGFVLAAINILVVLVNVSNLMSYRFEVGLTYDLLRLVWALVLLAWFSVQLYLFPIFYEMEKPTLSGALRNAALMVLLNPLFTLGLWVGIIPIALLSIAFPAAWLLLTGGLFAALGTCAVLNRLKAAGYQNPEHMPPLEPTESEL